MFSKSYCPLGNACLERLISVWVRSILNSSWNCVFYFDKVCMVLFIMFLTCFIWCWCWPPSAEGTFSFFDFVCVFSTAVFRGDGFDGEYGRNCPLLEICDSTKWFIFIYSISFHRTSISFCNVSFLFLFCFAVTASVDAFLLMLWLLIVSFQQNN